MSTIGITLSKTLLDEFDVMLAKRGANRSSMIRMLITRELIDSENGINTEFCGLKMELADTVRQNFSSEGQTTFIRSMSLVSLLEKLGIDFGMITDRSKQMYLSSVMADIGFQKVRTQTGKRGYMVVPVTEKAIDLFNGVSQ